MENNVKETNYRPVKFALISLTLIFFLYQVIGGGIIALLFGVSPRADQTNIFRFATIIGQFLLILVPAYFLSKLQTKDWKELLKIRKTDLYYIGLAIIGVIALEQLLEIYLYFQDMIPLPGNIREVIDALRQTIDQTYKILLNAHSLPEFLLVLLVVAVTPAVCEEVLFRGLVLGNFERSMKRQKAIFWTGLIFGFYHVNPFSLIPLIVLGIYLSYLAAETGSILVPIAAHFTNNFISALIYFASGKDSLIDTNAGETINNIYIIVLALMLAIIFLWTLKNIREHKKALSHVANEEGEK
ncbi:MAG: CPBP family glutamic-type intramembrane protease [Candidatus Kryptoniota bacterium]